MTIDYSTSPLLLSILLPKFIDFSMFLRLFNTKKTPQRLIKFSLCAFNYRRCDFLQFFIVKGSPFPSFLPSYSSTVSFSSFSVIARQSSSNCFRSTPEGASVIRSDASFTFGNAMTSRMESACTICITIRSKP